MGVAEEEEAAVQPTDEGAILPVWGPASRRVLLHVCVSAVPGAQACRQQHQLQPSSEVRREQQDAQETTWVAVSSHELQRQDLPIQVSRLV